MAKMQAMRQCLRSRLLPGQYGWDPCHKHHSNAPLAIMHNSFHAHASATSPLSVSPTLRLGRVAQWGTILSPCPYPGTKPPKLLSPPRGRVGSPGTPSCQLDRPTLSPRVGRLGGHWRREGMTIPIPLMDGTQS